VEIEISILLAIESAVRSMNDANNKRKRGVTLTIVGRNKLATARDRCEQQHNFGNRYTIEQLSELTALSPNTLNKILIHNTAVDKSTLARCFTTFGLLLTPDDCQYQNGAVPQIQTELPQAVDRYLAWGEAPDVSIFYGRDRELQTLTDWIEGDRCRLVAIVGMGGMGKTALATKLAYELQSQFTAICWRSLRNAPSLASLLPELIQICSQERDIVVPGSTTADRISQLIHHLGQNRCLLVLDNVETILQSGNSSQLAGNYRSDYEDYGLLFERIGTSIHQSCLLLTSREKPTNIAYLAADDRPSRISTLAGLDRASSDRLFNEKALSASPVGRARLVHIYNGNPLALKIVATTVEELFDRDIDSFLAEETFIFDEIRQLFDRQFERLSEQERLVMYWLTIERTLVTLADLQAQIVPTAAKSEPIETLKSLGRRCLTEQSQGKFTQPTAIFEYMTERLVERIAIELQQWNGRSQPTDLPLWWSLPLLKAGSPEYIRTSQRQQILTPIAERSILHFGSIDNLVAHLQAILASLQRNTPNLANYGGGNLFNLLHHLQVDLSGYDFSHLALWQTDFQGMTLHDVNLTGADLSQSLFTKTFGRVYAMAISPDGRILATSDDSGTIWLWRISDRQPIGKLVGHSNFSWALLFIPDLQLLVSASQDGKIGIWDLQTQAHKQWLQTDEYPVHSIAYDRRQRTLVSGHGNGTVRVWSSQTWLEIANWRTHDEPSVYALPVAFSPDYRTLATGSSHGTIKLWNATDWQLEKALAAEGAQFFYALAFSYDGRMLVGGSDDVLVVWDIASGDAIHQLQGHQSRSNSIVASPNTNIFASGSIDTTIKIWDFTTGKLIKTIAEHQDWIWSLQFSPDGKFLTSSCADQSVRFWDTTTWQCVQGWTGYNNMFWGMTFNRDGSKLLTASQDGFVRMWDLSTRRIMRTFHDRDRPSDVWSVDWYADTIASSQGNGLIHLWDADCGERLRTCAAHQGTVWTVKFSPDGRLLASAGIDSTMCLWSVATGELVAGPIVIDSIVRSLCFSPDGRYLATANFDGVWRLWEVATATLVGSYRGHTSWLWSIDFSADGCWIATGSSDRTVKLWDAATGHLIHTFTGHTKEISFVRFSPDCSYLAACSNVGETFIWQIADRSRVWTSNNFDGAIICFSPDGRWLANCLNSVITIEDWLTDVDGYTLELRPPYHGMQIANVSGLTPATISMLEALGAIS
jgi:WD40 repeat protein